MLGDFIKFWKEFDEKKTSDKKQTAPSEPNPHPTTTTASTATTTEGVSIVTVYTDPKFFDTNNVSFKLFGKTWGIGVENIIVGSETRNGVWIYQIDPTTKEKIPLAMFYNADCARFFMQYIVAPARELSRRWL